MQTKELKKKLFKPKLNISFFAKTLFVKYCPNKNNWQMKAYQFD